MKRCRAVTPGTVVLMIDGRHIVIQLRHVCTATLVVRLIISVAMQRPFIKSFAIYCAQRYTRVNNLF